MMSKASLYVRPLKILFKVYVSSYVKSSSFFGSVAATGIGTGERPKTTVSLKNYATILSII